MKTLILVLSALLCTGPSMVKAQQPLLNSYPSASHVIFLDFDGHNVVSTGWNTNGPIQCSPAGLNTSQITEIFNRVAEDYRPFRLNITTDSARFLSAPVAQRMRVIITTTSSWYGSNAGGVSFVGSFTWGDDTPCFVFPALVSNNIKTVSEIVSHEAGHSLGLFHQSLYDANCNKISDYNSGTGSGEIGWAPIMGVGYYKNFTLWNIGPNSFGCTNVQNDLSVITGSNGFGYRNDDHRQHFDSATLVSFSSNQFIMDGIIERNGDADLFRFSMPTAGRLLLDAIPYNVGSNNNGANIDLQVSLYNSSRTLMNTYNPGELLGVILDTLLAPGNYFIRIEGKGNIYAPDYASLGSYKLQGMFGVGAALPLRKLELRGTVGGSRHQLNWVIDADEQVVQQVLEVSTDGRNFSPVNEPVAAQRSYAYHPNATRLMQYRLSVLFDNNRRYYSNVITMRNNETDKHPVLNGNLVTSNTVSVSSPGPYGYMIYELSGKTVSKGQLIAGNQQLSLPGIRNGFYFIKFYDRESQWVEKFSKQ